MVVSYNEILVIIYNYSSSNDIDNSNTNMDNNNIDNSSGILITHTTTSNNINSITPTTKSNNNNISTTINTNYQYNKLYLIDVDSADTIQHYHYNLTNTITHVVHLTTYLIKHLIMELQVMGLVGIRLIQMVYNYKEDILTPSKESIAILNMLK